MQGKLCPSTAACPVHCVGLTNTTFHNDTSETLLSTEDDLWSTCLVHFLKQSFLLQFLGCWIIFCAANVVKALLAKKMASHFHKQTHFQKMRDAIKKVCLDKYMRCFKMSNWKWTCTGMYKACMCLWMLSSNATAACPNINHGSPAFTSTG